MNANIAVIAMTDDGTAREVLLDPGQRETVKSLLMQMFEGRPIPVSETELPLEEQGACLTQPPGK